MKSEIPFAQRYRWLRSTNANLRAMNSATEAFLDAMQQGQDAVDALHTKHCGKPPIPVKVKS